MKIAYTRVIAGIRKQKIVNSFCMIHEDFHGWVSKGRKHTFIKAKFLLQIHDVLRGHQQHGNVRDHDGGAGGRPAGLRLHLLQVHPHWAATVQQAVSQEVRVRPANMNI